VPWGAGVAIALLAVFLSELLTPLGLAHGLLYALVVLVAALSGRRELVIACAAVAAVLTLLGILISPPADGAISAAVVAGNRLLALVAIGLTCLLALRLQRELASAHAAAAREQALRLELARQHRMLDIASEVARLGGWSVDLATRTVHWTDETARIFEAGPGFRPSVEEAIAFYAPEHRERLRARFDACATQGTPYDAELELVTATGRRLWVRAVGRPVRDAAGRIVEVEGALQDISARRLAEQARAESDERFRRFAEVLPLMIWSARPTGELDYINRHLADYAGLDSEQSALGEAWLALLHPEERAAVAQVWARHLASGDPYQARFRVRRADGAYRWHQAHATPSRDAHGRIERWYGTCIEVHELQALQEEASILASRLATTLDSISDAFLLLDRDWRVRFVNAAAERLLRRRRSELLDRVVWEAFPEARGSVFEQQYQRALDEGYAVEFEAYFEPLQILFEVRAFPSADGLAIYFRDVTERHAVEQRLREAQRMESIGQLTGGVAHDFNNLLTVILGNAEVLTEQLDHDSAQRLLADMIASAAQRAAELTQRLLAFARRQALEPRATDVNALVAGLDALLRRTLGEHVEIEFSRGAGLWQAMVDSVQLESALLNLCINARDAMPTGGRLTIETGNAHLDRDYADRHAEVVPGQYVMLAVSDTGTGIAPEHLPRVFEPFFTTKDKGKGTGLGLAMVYGFVKQSGGHVKVYSEVGQGTTVRMYLPRVAAADLPAAPPGQAAVGAPGGGVILLVEDDDLVRTYAARELRDLGYTVIAASNGPSALEIVREREDIDLLFTDVVMPGGMSGRQLAEAALSLRPRMRVLYTSGYTENAIVHHGRLDAGVRLLSKPYRKAELARSVREALEHSD
jgi:PAS domain S-box-containing protein